LVSFRAEAPTPNSAKSVGLGEVISIKYLLLSFHRPEYHVGVLAALDVLVYSSRVLLLFHAFSIPLNLFVVFISVLFSLLLESLSPIFVLGV